MAFRRRKRKGPDPEPHGEPAHEAGPFDGAPVPVHPVDPSGEPLRNTAIVEAMRNVALDDAPETRALLYQLLLDATLVVATPDVPAAPSVHTAQQGETLALITLEDENGPVLPVFTSTDTLLAWRRELTGFVALPARALFEMAVGAGTQTLVIDPGSPTYGSITRREVEALARGRLPIGPTDVIAEATTVRIGRPAQLPPAEVLDAVRAALAAHGRVTGAWLHLMQQGETPPELVIGVRFAPEVASDPGALRDGMRAVVDGASNRSVLARELLFVHADDDLAASLAGGAGIDLLHP